MNEMNIMQEFMDKISIDNCQVELTTGYDNGNRESDIDSMNKYIEKGKNEKVHVSFLEGIGDAISPKQGKRSRMSNISHKCLVTFDLDLKDNMEKALFNTLKSETKRNITGEIFISIKEQLESLFETPLMVNFTGNGLHIHYYINPIEFDRDVWRVAYQNIISKLERVTCIKFDDSFKTGSQLKRIPLSWSFKTDEGVKGECLFFDKSANSTDQFKSFFINAEKEIKDKREKAIRKALENLSGDDEHKETVKSMLNMNDICNHFGLNFSGRNPCNSPIRTDKNPSFSFNDNKKVFIDHGTSQSGDYFDLIGLVMNTTDFALIIKEAQEITGIMPTKREQDFSHVPKFAAYKQNISELAEKKNYFELGKSLCEAFDGFWWQGAYSYSEWKDFQEDLDYDRRNQGRCMALYRIHKAMNDKGLDIEKPGFSACGHLFKIKNKKALDVDKAIKCWVECVENKTTSVRQVEKAVKAIKGFFRSSSSQRRKRRSLDLLKDI